jgi:hypothetical protein
MQTKGMAAGGETSPGQPILLEGIHIKSF